jgi:hypothetical protein
MKLINTIETAVQTLYDAGEGTQRAGVGGGGKHTVAQWRSLPISVKMLESPPHLSHPSSINAAGWACAFALASSSFISNIDEKGTGKNE